MKHSVVGDPATPLGATIQIDGKNVGWVRVSRDKATVADPQGRHGELRGPADEWEDLVKRWVKRRKKNNSRS